MKFIKSILAGASLALLTSVVFATTPSPITTLNSGGSTAGMAIISTGSGSPPAWGNVSIATLTGILPVASGGTNAATASGTSLDNITGFSGTGFLTRTGAGTYAFQSATNGITLGNLAQTGANTVLSNATGSTANLTAFSMPSCSSSVSALNWTSGSGFTCNTGLITGATVSSTYLPTATAASTYATIAQATTALSATGGSINGVTVGQSNPLAGSFTTLTATSAVTVPSGTTFNQPNIVGVTSGAAAATGSVGEQPTANASGVSLTTATTANAASKTLTAGQYLVWCTAQFLPAGTTVGTVYAVGISTTSAVRPGSYAAETLNQYSSTAGTAQQISSPTVPINIATSTTVYCTAYAGFSTSTMTVSGTINALRVH